MLVLVTNICPLLWTCLEDPCLPSHQESIKRWSSCESLWAIFWYQTLHLSFPSIVLSVGRQCWSTPRHGYRDSAQLPKQPWAWYTWCARRPSSQFCWLACLCPINRTSTSISRCGLWRRLSVNCVLHTKLNSRWYPSSTSLSSLFPPKSRCQNYWRPMPVLCQ